MTFQIEDFLIELHDHEESETIEKIGFVKGLDLITLLEKLRKHGVRK